MNIKYKITKLQLFSLLFLNPTIFTLTYSKEFFPNSVESIWDFLISTLISYILSFILIVPSYMLYKNFPNFSFFTPSTIGVINTILYSIYFIAVSCYCVSIFRLFTLSVLPYDSQIFLLTILMFICIVYSSFKGINSIARASVIIFSLVTVSLILILFSLSKKIEITNFPIFMRNGNKNIINGLLYMTSRHFAMPILTFLLPFSNEKPGKFFFIWNTCIHLFFSSVVFISVGALGPYIKTQIFPFYSATKVAQIGVFRRLDTIYIGIFVTGLLIISATFFNMFRWSIENVKDTKLKKIALLIGGTLVLFIGCFFDSSKNFYCFIYNTNLFLILIFISSILLPFTNLIIEKICSKKGVRER